MVIAAAEEAQQYDEEYNEEPEEQNTEEQNTAEEAVTEQEEQETEQPADPAAETPAPTQAVTEAPAEQTKDVTETVEAIRAMIGQPVQDLYDFIGEPTGGTDYGPSCLVTGGQDGQLFYDGFCVYTLVKPDGSESIYDIEAN